MIPGGDVSCAPWPGCPSSVVARSRREGLTAARGKLDPGKLEETLGAVLARAAGEEDAVDALRRLFRPADVVGIKLNCLAGRGLYTEDELCDYEQIDADNLNMMGTVNGVVRT